MSHTIAQKFAAAKAVASPPALRCQAPGTPEKLESENSESVLFFRALKTDQVYVNRDDIDTGGKSLTLVGIHHRIYVDQRRCIRLYRFIPLQTEVDDI